MIHIRSTLIVGLAMGALATYFPLQPAFSDGDWGFHLGPGGFGISYHDDDKHFHFDSRPSYHYRPGYTYSHRPRPVYSWSDNRGDFYPQYRPYNPVVRRDVTERGRYNPDGTIDSETTVEDRRASFYSPGRNSAVTPPQTTITRHYGPDGTWREREETRWIGADGRPHSTIIDRETSQNIWGDTHTDTHVTLKGKKPKEGSNPKEPDQNKDVKSPVTEQNKKR